MGKLIDGVMPMTRSTRPTAKERSSARTVPQLDRRSSGCPVPAGGWPLHLYVAYACPWAHRALIFRR